jgi:hypothetical protein
MADNATNTQASAWNTTFANYTQLTQRLDHAQRQERDQVEREICALQDELLDSPAPTLTAVLQKLEILFEGQIHGLDQGSEERRLVLEDLEGLIQAQRELLGV